MNPVGEGGKEEAGCGRALAKSFREVGKRGEGRKRRSEWKLIQWKSLALSVDNSNFITGAKDYDLLETSSQSTEATLVKHERRGREESRGKGSEISGSELQTALKGPHVGGGCRKLVSGG